MVKLISDKPASQRNALLQVSPTDVGDFADCGRHNEIFNDLWTNITCASPSLGQWVKLTLVDENGMEFLEIEIVGF